MTAAAGFVTALTAVAFAALGVAAGIDWLRHPDRRRGMLALALASLGLVAAVPQFVQLFTLSDLEAKVYLAVVVALFLASGYFILLFRHSFIPLPASIRWAAAVITVAVAVVVTAVEVSPLAASRGWQTFIALLLSLCWAVLVGEPIVRFWSASRTLPRVQRQRMRALGTAFAVLIMVLLVSTLGGSATRNPNVIVITQLVALAMVPLIWVSMAPPGWLRRQWRAGEEQALQRAVTDLLIFSPGRVALAEKAVGWAARAVGGSGALLADGDGSVLASTGLDPKTVAEIRTAHGRNLEAMTMSLDGGRTAIAVSMPLEAGPGLLAVLSGPFTPVFGSDEILWLGAYASSVTAGLERARVTERLAAMERTKTQFLNLASHELRGPLTVIRGYVSMLESGALGPLNEDGARALQIMGVKATEMNGLVEQMLEAARLEEGRLELRVAKHDLREVVRSSIEQLRPLVDDRHPIMVDVPERPVTVEVDADRIQTIVTNLLDNAVKYSPQGGDVRVEVVDARPGPRVRIHDQGVGIDAHDLPRLFTRFGRVATAATRHLPGTGLGLYLSRELARLHGGDITVESKPGQGSTFTLQLPTRAI